MKKNQLILLLIVASFSFTMTSCYYDKKIQEEIIDLPESVSYAADIQPIWDANCILCHKGSLSPDMRKDQSYNALANFITAGDAANSLVYKYLNGEGTLMPPTGKISQNDINLVKEWINDGALNN